MVGCIRLMPEKDIASHFDRVARGGSYYCEGYYITYKSSMGD